MDAEPTTWAWSHLRTSVGARLTMAAALVAVVATTLLVALALATSWRTEGRHLDETERLIRTTHLPALVSDIWDYSPRLHEDVDKLLRFPHLVHVALSGPGLHVEAGKPPVEGDAIRVVMPLEHVQGGHLGELRLAFSLASMRAVVLGNAGWLAIEAALPILITIAAILLLFRRLVGRHLDSLSRHARTLTIDTLDRPFTFARPPAQGQGDELDRLARSLEGMRTNLQHEIARRRHVEAELQTSEQRYREVFNAVGDGIVIHDAATGDVLEVNAAMLAIVGSDRERFLGNKADLFSEGKPPFDQVHALRHLRLASEGQPQLFEWRSRHTDGHLVWVEVYLKYVVIASRGLIIASVRNIEARKQAEERLHQYGRMESIGQLAGGIAHDFNNMLSGIIGSAELLRRHLPAEDPRRRQVDIIFDSGQRAADLTRKLLSFARRGIQVDAVIDAHAVVDATCALLEHTIDRRITVERRLVASWHLVRGDVAELEHALLNLCLNARDAMPDGGTLIIATADAELDAAACQAMVGFSLVPGRFLRLEVRDTGTGIASEVLPYIFDPFFTTKTVGKGTGLGLSAVYGTIVAHGGAVLVESRLGMGATFTLLLPVTEGTVKAPIQEPVEVRHSGLILVVDDEELVSKTTCDMLRALGYGTVSASNGLEAEAMLRADQGHICAVLHDLVMPGRSIADSFHALRAIRPDLRIVLYSGFPRDAHIDALLAAGNATFMQKPFHLGDLARTLGDKT